MSSRLSLHWCTLVRTYVPTPAYYDTEISNNCAGPVRSVGWFLHYWGLLSFTAFDRAPKAHSCVPLHDRLRTNWPIRQPSHTRNTAKGNWLTRACVPDLCTILPTNRLQTRNKDLSSLSGLTQSPHITVVNAPCYLVRNWSCRSDEGVLMEWLVQASPACGESYSALSSWPVVDGKAERTGKNRFLDNREDGINITWGWGTKFFKL